MDHSAPVCVVGAGQTGILAAAELTELGYTHVDVFEAGAQLGGYCETVEADGAVYDMQAHLVIQQAFGADAAGTAIEEILGRHPVATQAEALHFVERSEQGGPVFSVPPHFLPLLRTLTPVQMIDQLVEAWTLIERAVRDRTGPGLSGLAFDGRPGETWESHRARLAPLTGEILQGLVMYANMRRPRQPAEVVVNANAHISGHVSQLAKLLLRLHPEEKDALLERMPPSLVAQIRSRKPIAVSFPDGFVSLLRRIVADQGLRVLTDRRVTRIAPLGSGGVRVTYRDGGAERHADYARVVVTARPSQIREISFADPAIAELFSEENCPRVWTRSFLIRVREELIAFPPSRSGGEPLGFWLVDPYGSYTDTDPEQALHRITAANKQHPGPYWVCFSNSDLSVGDEEAWRLAAESLFLFREPELVSQTIAEWPAYPSAAALRAGWCEQVDTVQGRDGVYFLGEVLSGPTAECISAYVRDVVPLWFGQEGPTA
jgi:hypothetical protein